MRSNTSKQPATITSATTRCGVPSLLVIGRAMSEITSSTVHSVAIRAMFRASLLPILYTITIAGQTQDSQIRPALGGMMSRRTCEGRNLTIGQCCSIFHLQPGDSPSSAGYLFAHVWPVHDLLSRRFTGVHDLWRGRRRTGWGKHLPIIAAVGSFLGNSIHIIRSGGRLCTQFCAKKS